MMIVLIALAPVFFAVNHQKHPQDLLVQVNMVSSVVDSIDLKTLDIQNKAGIIIIKERNDSLRSMLTGITNFKNLKKESNLEIRKDILMMSKETKNLFEGQDTKPISMSKKDKKILLSSIKEMRGFTEYVPWWVILLISASLGLGTMIGWKRIVVTIGEKIGKEKMNYAQGASANMVTGLTIWAASEFGLPVSTTHILSSGVAGSMFATKGKKNLSAKTLTNILIAWVITIPVTIIMAGGLLLLFRLVL